MSLYNLLFGMNPLSDLYLGMVGLCRTDVGRFRDCYIEKTAMDPSKSEFDSSNGGGRWIVHVYTRNGGGNRDHYDDETKSGPECSCTGCIASYRLPSHPLYLMDEDDDFDCTYATFTFQAPSQFWPFLEDLTEMASQESTPKERWTRLFEKLESSKEDPEVKNAMSVMAPILDRMKAALNGSEEETPSNG